MFEVPLVSTLLSRFRPSCIDDFADRLNYHVTASLLCFFCVLLSAKQYVGSPIECWFSYEYAAYQSYIDSYCFVKNTFVSNDSRTIPADSADRKALEIGYYQWVPLLLVFQALLFHMPHQLWNLCCWQSGLNVKCLLKAMQKANLMDMDRKEREYKIKYMTQFLKDSLDMHRLYDGVPCGERVRACYRCVRGSWLSVCYLLVKCVCLANIYVQFRVIDWFLGGGYINWGWQVLVEFLQTGNLQMESASFPRVTYCEFKLLMMGDNVQTNTVQCVLPSNILNEKAFLFLWYWLWAVGICTAVNLVYWLISSVSRTYRTHLIERLLRHAGLTTAMASGDPESGGCSGSPVMGYATRKHFLKFVLVELGVDGVLVVRLLIRQVGDLPCVAVVSHLWTAFLRAEMSPTAVANGQQCRCYGCDSSMGTETMQPSMSVRTLLDRPHLTPTALDMPDHDRGKRYC